MNLEETPGLTDAERAAVAAYEEAHRSYAASVMGERFKAVARAEHEAADRIDHAIERVEETYSRLSNPRVLQEISATPGSTSPSTPTPTFCRAFRPARCSVSGGASTRPGKSLPEAVSSRASGQISGQAISKPWTAPLGQEKPRVCGGFCGALGRTRTCDLLIRSQTLYPAELRAHREHVSYRRVGHLSRPVLIRGCFGDILLP